MLRAKIIPFLTVLLCFVFTALATAESRSERCAQAAEPCAAVAAARQPDTNN